MGDIGVHVNTLPDANHPERRNYSIQVLAGYMERNLPDGVPCFRMSDRFLVVSREKPAQSRTLLVDGFEAGYVWDALSMARTASPNTRRPRKDGTFDHGMNTCEYAALHYAPAAPASLAGVYHTEEEKQRIQRQQERAERQALRLAQRDDPASRSPAPRRLGRAGY